MKGMQPPRCYPSDLAAKVRQSWPADADPLPRTLERVLDAAYHASFLREEERAVSCRIALASPAALGSDGAPPFGLLALEFDQVRRFDEHELRRLSPAVKYHRALVGVCEADDALVTWGFVQSGPRWLQSAKGGRGGEPPMPRVPVIRVVRPGHVGVSCGSSPIAELRGGRLLDFTLDCFASRWLPERFAAERDEIAGEHVERGGTGKAEDVSAMTRHLAQQMLKRVIATMRAAHHGGALVVVPPSCTPSRVLAPKYTFRDAASRRTFRRIVHGILGELGRAGSVVSPELYRTAPGQVLADLDEGLFELSHLVASLADVDGAVILTRRFEVLGFAAEIAGDLPIVTDVRRALDVEADEYLLESTDAVGTRHRSAYRLCAAVPDALAIVVSQDGGVRFVANHRGAVTYWDHGAGDE